MRYLYEDYGDESIDMFLCDFPYTFKGKNRVTANKWDLPIDDKKFFELAMKMLTPEGAIVLTASQPFTSYLVSNHLEYFKYEWIWEKVKGTGFLNAKRQPMRNHELISVFYKKQCIYNPQKTCGHKLKKSYRSKYLQTEVYGEMKNDYIYESTERYPRSIQVFSTDTQNSSLHPTQKPVALVEYLINTYTNPYDLVLDNTAGSMTLAIAAINTGRNYICIEKDKEIFEVGKRRVEEYLKERLNK